MQKEFVGDKNSKKKKRVKDDIDRKNNKLIYNLNKSETNDVWIW